MTRSHNNKRRPPPDLMAVVHEVVEDFGVNELASKTGASRGTIANKINANESSHHIPTLADAVVWPQVMGDDRIPEAYCRAVGGVFVSLRGMAEQSDAALLDLVMRREKEEGDAAGALGQSLEDGRISPDDFVRIEREEMEAIAARLTVLERVRGMVQ